MSDKESRTEKATPKRLAKNREEGRVPISSESIAVTAMICSTAALTMVLNKAGSNLLSYFRTVFSNLDQLAQQGPTEWTRSSIQIMASFVVPVALAGSLGALAVGLGQTRGLFSLKKLTRFDFSFLFNPLPALKRLLISKDTVIMLLRSLIKVVVVVGFTWRIFLQELQVMVDIGTKTPLEILSRLWSTMLNLGARIGACLIVFSVVDYLWVRYRTDKDMRMTKQEVKQEHREGEGSPEVKKRQRGKQQEVVRGRMMGMVKKADVVVVNPTHYAVALRYDSATMASPKVVAKGKNLLAARIRELARGHRIPIVHNPPLTRSLYAEVKVGRMVPPHLFGAVAEILAYVYRLRGRMV